MSLEFCGWFHFSVCPAKCLLRGLVIVPLSSNLKAAIFSLSKNILNTGLWEKSFPALLTIGDLFFPTFSSQVCFKSKAVSCWHDLLSPPQPENSLPAPGPERKSSAFVLAARSSLLTATEDSIPSPVPLACKAMRTERQYMLLLCFSLPSVQRRELLQTEESLQLHEEELIQEGDWEAQLTVDMETDRTSFIHPAKIQRVSTPHRAHSIPMLWTWQLTEHMPCLLGVHILKHLREGEAGDRG